MLHTLACLLQVDGVKQELKDALQSSSKELYKQLLKTGAGWVRPPGSKCLRQFCVLAAVADLSQLLRTISSSAGPASSNSLF
jgi:hypothetical protein